MASTSASRSANPIIGRIKTATSTICSENQSLIADFRRTIGMMKEIAMELERHNKTQMVKEVEDTVLELLDSYEDCTCFSTVMQSVSSKYEPKPELTNFKSLFENELSKVKASKSRDPHKSQLLRQFREAVWNVHHAGELMPGDEEEDIVMTNRENSLMNFTCPLSGKSVTALEDPVCSLDCKHIYDKKAITHHIKSNGGLCPCPSAGCPKQVRMDRVVSDPLLQVEIDEYRTLMSKHSARTEDVEDITGLADDK